MAHTRSRMKGRRNSRHYSQLIHEYFQSPQYALLSARAVKALIDVYCQYRGQNNGDLCATISVMRARGWKSKDQLAKAIAELLEKGWLMVTRQGARNIPTLYAVTFLGIDDCGGKLDVTPNPVPLHLWKKPVEDPAPVISLPRHTGQVTPRHGARMAA